MVRGNVRTYGLELPRRIPRLVCVMTLKSGLVVLRVFTKSSIRLGVKFVVLSRCHLDLFSCQWLRQTVDVGPEFRL